MARIKTIDRAEKDVGTPSGGTLINIFRVHGWAMNMDESVLFDATIQNPGPRPVRFGHCKPFTFGPWQIIDFISAPYTYKPDNEDQFFFAQIQDTNGTWVNVDGSEGHSSNQLLNEGSPSSGVIMSWTTQNITLTLRAH